MGESYHQYKCTQVFAIFYDYINVKFVVKRYGKDLRHKS